MKILHIYGNMQHYDYGLGALQKRVQSVFTELGVEIENIDLGVVHPPYYDGETTQGIDGIVEGIKNSDGIVFACTSQLFAPSALMQSFLEYLEHPDYHQALMGKHCLLISLSQDGGEKSALEYLTRVVQHLGGYAVTQVGLQAHHVQALDLEDEIGEFVDKTAEDFYRAVNQKRKYVIPQDIVNSGGMALAPNIPVAPQAAAVTTDPLLHAGAAQLQAPRNYLTDRQEQEVDEIAQLLSEKLSKGSLSVPEEEDFGFPEGLLNSTPAVSVGIPGALSVPLTPPPARIPGGIPSPPVEHRAKTARQITQNLPHYFQPQLSAGLQASIQISIKGSEAFEGFLYIHSTECSYSEGQAPAPDVTIMADTAVWMDVLKGKQTAQKAFMIGGLKVRGDFVLLTKFDALFKMENS